VLLEKVRVEVSGSNKVWGGGTRGPRNYGQHRVRRDEGCPIRKRVVGICGITVPKNEGEEQGRGRTLCLERHVVPRYGQSHLGNAKKEKERNVTEKQG